MVIIFWFTYQGVPRLSIVVNSLCGEGRSVNLSDTRQKHVMSTTVIEHELDLKYITIEAHASKDYRSEYFTS